MHHRRKERREDYTDVAFVIAAIFAGATIAVAEDVLSSATDEAFWSTWRFHPASAFLGALAFASLLYFLQLMNDQSHALPLRFYPILTSPTHSKPANVWGTRLWPKQLA